MRKVVKVLQKPDLLSFRNLNLFGRFQKDITMDIAEQVILWIYEFKKKMIILNSSEYKKFVEEFVI